MSQDQVRDCRKLFVLDTNVILHDAGCIERFRDNDIAIPITVLEELDQFKKGNQDIHFQAREFLRRLDQLTGDVLSSDGASLGKDRGHIRIVLCGDSQDRLQSVFFRDCPDHRILNTAITLQQQFPDRPVILVTKDANLRVKARATGLRAEDYTSDKIEGLDKLYSGKRIIDNVPCEAIETFYVNGGLAPSSLFPEITQPIANENFVLRNGSLSALARYRAADQSLLRVEKQAAYGISPRNAELITRAGEGTKIVFTGDIHQIDHPYLDCLSNGLSYLISRMVGHSLYAHVTLEKGERSELADLASELL